MGGERTRIVDHPVHHGLHFRWRWSTALLLRNAFEAAESKELSKKEHGAAILSDLKVRWLTEIK